MSTGGFIGGIVGGIIGFVIGGPTGMLYGAALGFGLGMMVDPMTPDVPSAGAPLPMAAEVMDTTIGTPLPDLLGTAKITGHLLCFGKERTITLTEEQEGGKGGGSDPDPYVTGYEYYMSWAVGIAVGPIDTLYAIYKGDDVVWEGELDIPVDPDLHGQETIVLTGETPQSSIPTFDLPFGDPVELPSAAPGMGTAIFYFGTNNQIVNSDVGDIIGDDTLNSPYRNFCWCFFDDCYIGKFNRCPTMKFIVKKSPEIALLGDNVIQTYDYNPIHATWYILHNLAELPEEWLHTDDFATAASTIAGETRGICCLLAGQQSALDYLESITNHIDGIIRYGSDGKFHPKLIRNDYVVDDLPLIDENVMLDDPTLKRKSWIDTVNEVKVQYTELLGFGPFPQGEWVAAQAQIDSTYIYLFDIDYRAVIKVDTSIIPPVCRDTLQVTDFNLDYGKGRGASGGGQRGGYCMSNNGTHLWYLFRTDRDCELVEVNIAGYYLEIVRTTSFSSLMGVDETIQDGCSDGTYTYWGTSLISGRIIKIKNSDHSIVDDHLFSFDLYGCATNQQGVVTLDYSEETGWLYWLYVLDYYNCIPRYTACTNYMISDTNFNIKVDRKECGIGFGTPQWQNMVRVMDDSFVLQHRSYHPSYGYLIKRTLSDFSPTLLCSTIEQEYLTNILGVDNGNLFTLMHYNQVDSNLWLHCINYNLMSIKLELDVLDYCDNSVSAMCSTYEELKIASLFRYSGGKNVITCFRANELLIKLCESYVSNKVRISYGS